MFDVIVEEQFLLLRVAFLRRDGEDAAHAVAPEPRLRLVAADRAAEKAQLVEVAVEAEPVVAAADAQRLRIADRPVERVARDVHRRCISIDENAYARGLARAVVAHDDLMPVPALHWLLRADLDRVRDPAIHEVDLHLAFLPQHLKAAPLAARVDFRKHAIERAGRLHPQADAPRLVRFQREVGGQLDVLHRIEQRGVAEQAGLERDVPAFRDRARLHVVHAREVRLERDVRRELIGERRELRVGGFFPIGDARPERLGELVEVCLRAAPRVAEPFQLRALLQRRHVERRRRIVLLHEAGFGAVVEEREELVILALRDRVELVITDCSKGGILASTRV